MNEYGKHSVPRGIPSGWYVVAAANEVRPGDVVARRYFDRELVIYRTASGILRIVDAHCPHLGAHLGAGRVDGESLRCPFHGFCFSTGGACVATPYGKRPPRAARLERWEVREQNGWILTWFDARGAEPSWEVPACQQEGWAPVRWRSYEVAGHPQETSENSVDFGHFTSVHKFLDARMTAPVHVDGPLLTTEYEIVRSLSMIGLPRRGVRARFHVSVWGLGFSRVELTVPGLGQSARLWVLPVPIDESHIELRLGCTFPLRYPLLSRIIGAFIYRGFLEEVEQDIPIWASKAYLPRPALADGDGPIGIYRSWARGFFPSGAADGSALSAVRSQSSAPGSGYFHARPDSLNSIADVV